MASSWLPEGFEHPSRLDLPTGHHLRPIREDDVAIDFPAVMGSRVRLWDLYGQAWGWPPETMTVEQDREDLARHAEEMTSGQSFNYAIFGADEHELLGCVYIDPRAQKGATGATVSWWVVDHAVGGQLEAALAEHVPRWLSQAWPFPEVWYGIESEHGDQARPATPTYAVSERAGGAEPGFPRAPHLRPANSGFPHIGARHRRGAGSRPAPYLTTVTDEYSVVVRSSGGPLRSATISLRMR